MVRKEIKNKYVPLLIIAVLVGMSWLSPLDKYPDDLTDDSIIQAGVAYVTARVINGVVSALQTSTVEVGVGLSGSIAFGEVLDPINDMIERFSDVMSLSLGSLFLQKIILVISAHNIFKVLITLAGVALCASIFFQNVPLSQVTYRIFILLVIIRLSFSVLVLVNGVVNSFFINQQISDESGKLDEFKSDMIRLRDNSVILDEDQNAYGKIIQADQQKLAEIDTTILPGLEKDLELARGELENAKTSLGKIQKERGWFDRINLLKSHTKADRAGAEVDEADKIVERLQDSIENYTGERKQLTEEIVDNKKRLAGEPVGILDKIKKSLPSVDGLKRNLSLDVIGDNLTDAVNNMIRLSVLFILKTVLLPIAFLYVLTKVVRRVWKADIVALFFIQRSM